MSCNTCNPCEEPICGCPVEIDAKCVTVTGEFECSSIESGLTLNQFLEELDAFICTKFNELAGYFALINVGNGAEIYAGINGIGQKKIRTITSNDSSINVIQNTDAIDISVDIDQDNFVRYIGIRDSDLSADATKAQIITYILSLPASERTIDETTSKLNIIHYNGTIEFVNFVYELQNTGKGIITSINEDDLIPLFIYKDVEGLDETLDAGNEAFGKIMYIRDSIANPNNRVSISPSSVTLFRPTGANINLSPELIGFYNPDFQGLGYDQNIQASVEGISMTSGGSPTSGDFMFLRFPTIVPNYIELLFPTDISGIHTIAVRSDIPIVDGSETKINNGITTAVNGNGTTSTPYVLETVNLQKSITDSYTLTSADDNYSIKVNNGSTPITITVPTGLPSNFFVGITQKGTADITLSGSGTTLINPTGLKIKGQGYYVGIEQIGTSNTFDILGNTKS